MRRRWYLPGKLERPREILVPYCWQAQFPDLREYRGWAWYQREFFLPGWLRGKRVFLNIGAVNYFPEIWINGEYVGRFEGGYIPVKVDISEHLKYGDKNSITVRVYYPDDLKLAEIPHGKQTWYCRVGGIWQSVWLEAASEAYIEDVFVIPDLRGGRATFKVSFRGLKPSISYVVKVDVVSPSGERFTKEAKVKADAVTVTIDVEEPSPWSPDSPQLYEARVTLNSEQEVMDSLSLRFGFREVEVKEGRLYLNGEPIYLKGALVQGFYPDAIYTPPSEGLIKEEIMRAKEMGFNLLCLHVKLPDPRYLDLADEIGILIWEELPHVDIFTSEAERLLKETLKAMVLRDRNHPSVVIWGIINEGWGVDPSKDEGRRWLMEAYKLVKELDPTRLVVDNSPCEGNFHIITDIADYHMYVSIPAGCREWGKFTDSLSKDPSWTFGPKSLRRGDEPALVSEFGTWGLPSLRGLRRRGADPWWFSLGWGSGVPKGVEYRFEECRLEEVWKGLEDLTKAMRSHQLESLKYMIEEIRRRVGIAGYVITQLYDLYWECNGLMDFYRRVKIPPRELAKAKRGSVAYSGLRLSGTKRMVRS